MTKTAERLQELLDKKDEEIEELRSQLQEADEKGTLLQAKLEAIPFGWCLPRSYEEDDETLPIPRLQITWHPLYDKQDPNDWDNYRVLYCLVYRHSLGHYVHIPLGDTSVRGGPSNGRNPKPWEPRKILDRDGGFLPQPCELPIREGPNVQHDAKLFALQAWAVPPKGTRSPFPIHDLQGWDLARKLGREHQRGATNGGSL